MHFENTPCIETERLRLRRFTEDDLGAAFRIFSDLTVNTYLPWYPAKDSEQTRAILEERFFQVYRQPRGYSYAICLKTDDIPIGYIHASTEEHHDFGYGLLPAFWHRGIVTEAGKALIEQLKQDDFRFITATHDVNTPRSGKVMRRLGMRYRYSYKEQWQPKNFPVTFRMYQLNFDGRDQNVYRKYWDLSAVRFIEDFDKTE